MSYRPAAGALLSRKKLQPEAERDQSADGRRCAQRLLGSLQYYLSRTTAGRSKGRPLQFVPRESEWSFLLGPVPVWEGTGFYVKGDGLIRFVDGVPAKVSDRSLHDGLVLLGSTFYAIVGREFGLAKARRQQYVAAIAIKARETLRIGTKGLHPVAIRADSIDRDIHPGSDELLFERLLLA